MSDHFEVPIANSVTEELETDVSFGVQEGEEDQSGFVARVNNQPIAVRFRDLNHKAGVPEDDAFSIFYQSFDLWLIPHRVAIIRRRGFAEPTSVGIEVEYLTDGRTCCIVSLLPSFDFVVHGNAAINGESTGRFSTSGMIDPAALDMSPISGVPPAGQLQFGVTADAHLGFKFRMTVATPRVAAIGIGSSRCEWRFDRDTEPLFGRDIETWAVVALPHGERKLSYRIRFYYNARTLFFNTRRESEWTTLRCVLTT